MSGEAQVSPPDVHTTASRPVVHSGVLSAARLGAEFRTLGRMRVDDGADGSEPLPQGETADPDDEFVRGQVRLVTHRRLAHGIYVKKCEGLSEDEEFRRDLRAWRLVLPDTAVFTHVTAARVLGWQLPKLPEQVPVFVAMDLKDTHPRRAGIVCSRLVRKAEPFGPEGLPVDAPEEILLRAARDFGVLDMVIMLDSALRLGHVDVTRMEVVLASKRPGVRVLKAAWALADKRAESGAESVLRLLHVAMDVRVEAQVELFDDDGVFLGRADLLVTGTHQVQEYDGAHHRAKEQQRTDLRRDRAIAGSAYRRRGYTMDDLINHPITVMHELDRMLGRPHEMTRLARWRRLVDNSLYSERGRERVLNRWRRRAPLLDWSKTA
jgi:hypothetical protein